MTSSIFKAYDIRGRYPEEINEEFAYKLGRAFVIATATPDVMLGRDARTHGPALLEAFTRGCIDQGADVTDIGLVTTSQMPAMRAWYGHDTGVIITASHLDPPFNGFKAYGRDSRPLSGSRGWPEVKDILERGAFPDALKKGERKTAHYTEAYTKRLHAFARPSPRVRFVADGSCGGVGEELAIHKRELHLDLTIINGAPDGTFPAHSPNPIAPGACDQAAATIRELAAAGGCVFDADADRIVFLDERGATIHPNHIACLLSEYFLARDRHATVCYDLISSRAIPETVERAGGTAVKTKVGYANVREAMMERDAVFGAESSSHTFFRDTAFAEATGLCMLLVMHIIEHEGKPLSELIKPFDRYALIPERNYTIADPDGAMHALEAAFPEAAKDYLDGVALTFPDGWIVLRKSNTEPLLRFRAEADTRERADEFIRRSEAVIAARGGTLQTGGH